MPSLPVATAILTSCSLVPDPRHVYVDQRTHGPLRNGSRLRPFAAIQEGIDAQYGYTRIFYRNSFNMGLPIFESPEAVDGTSKGDELEVDSQTGTIKNLTTGRTYQAQPIPPFMQELLADGGLMAHLKKHVEA